MIVSERNSNVRNLSFRFVDHTLLLLWVSPKIHYLASSPIRFDQCCQFDCMIWDYLFSSGSRSLYDDNNDDDDVTIGFFLSCFFFRSTKVRFCSIRFGFFRLSVYAFGFVCVCVVCGGYSVSMYSCPKLLASSSVSFVSPALRCLWILAYWFYCSCDV